VLYLENLEMSQQKWGADATSLGISPLQNTSMIFAQRSCQSFLPFHMHEASKNTLKHIKHLDGQIKGKHGVKYIQI
jgi:hypothetical protein